MNIKQANINILLNCIYSDTKVASNLHEKRALKLMRSPTKENSYMVNAFTL
jgi:hypothetical protein